MFLFRSSCSFLFFFHACYENNGLKLFFWKSTSDITCEHINGLIPWVMGHFLRNMLDVIVPLVSCFILYLFSLLQTYNQRKQFRIWCDTISCDIFCYIVYQLLFSLPVCLIPPTIRFHNGTFLCHPWFFWTCLRNIVFHFMLLYYHVW